MAVRRGRVSIRCVPTSHGRSSRQSVGGSGEELGQASYATASRPADKESPRKLVPSLIERHVAPEGPEDRFELVRREPPGESYRRAIWAVTEQGFERLSYGLRSLPSVDSWSFVEMIGAYLSGFAAARKRLEAPSVAIPTRPVSASDAVGASSASSAARAGLVSFAFSDQLVRAMERAGQAWFVLADVCRVLELINVSSTASRVPAEERGTVLVADAMGRQQAVTIVNEPGLSRVILTSRKPIAAPFKDWIVREVIPSLVKDGHVGPEDAADPRRVGVLVPGIVEAKEGRLITTSRHVADFFGKAHRHVLRDIDSLISHGPDLGRGVSPHFVEVRSPHPTISGRVDRYFELDRTGLTLLAMGFNGAKALEWKLLYIQAFDRMEEQLRAAPVGMPDLGDPALLRNLLLGYTTRLIEAEEKVSTLTDQVSTLEPKAAALDRISAKDGEANITDTAKALGVRRTDFVTWCSSHGWLYRRHEGGHWVAYQDKINAGYLVHRERPDRSREDRTFPQVMVTPKGRAKLAQLLAGRDLLQGARP